MDQYDVSSEHRSQNLNTAVPWVFFRHGKAYEKHIFLGMKDKAWQICGVRRVRKFRNRDFMPTPQGWLLTQEVKSGECSLLRPLSSDEIPLPPLKRQVWYAVLSKSLPTDQDCRVVVLAAKYELLSCSVNKNAHGWEWVKHCFQPFDPHPLQPVAIANFQEKIYVMFGDGSVVALDPEDPHQFSQVAGSPELNWGAGSFRYLVSAGDILYTVLVEYTRRTNTALVKVYKLDFSISSWVRVTDIGDHAFFVCSLGAVSAPVGGGTVSGSVGLRRNCVYYLNLCEQGVFTYSLDDCDVSMKLPSCDIPSPWTSPLWLPSPFQLQQISNK